MPQKIIKNAFNAGELGEHLSGRQDLAKYYNGCSQLVNFTPLPQGGAVKRPGLQYITTAKGKNKLITFEFSVTDTHILEFGPSYMRIYKDGAAAVITAASVSNWVAATAYSVNDQIEDLTTEAGNYYYCSTAHTSGAGDDMVDAGDRVNWVKMTASGTNLIQEIFTPYDNVTDWITGVTYATGDEIYEPGTALYYVCSTTGNGKTAGTFATDLAAGYWTAADPTATESFGFHYVQSADVMYLAHVDVRPYKLSRLGDTSWTLVPISFTGGPFIDSNTDTTKTLTFTQYTGAHITTDNSAALIVGASTFVADTLVGFTVYNITDGSSATITANTATGVTGTLSGGTGDEWDVDDVYEIGTSENFYHITDAVGVLSATGHDPFVAASHDGSQWELVSSRIGDTYAAISGELLDGTVSSEIEIYGDFTVSTSGYDSTDINTLTLQRKTLQGVWQNDRKFTAATAYSAIELVSGVFYRLRYTGSTASAQFNATLTASQATTHGVVEIIDVIDEDEAVAKVVDKVFVTPTQSDVAFTNLNQAGTGIVTVLTAATVVAGDTIIFKGITNTLYTHLNIDTGGSNYTVITASAGVDFTFYSGDEDNLAADATGVGEFYVLGEITTTSDWAEGAWSTRTGYPRTTNFHEDRLWWASNDNQPQTLWGSKTSQYENHTVGVFDNEAINFTLNDRDVSQIQWMVSKTLMAVGTASKEYVFGAANPEDPITPSDRKAKNQSAYGSNTIQPVILEDAVFFHQRSGKKLRAMKFDLRNFALTASNASILNPVIMELSATTMTAQKIPDSIVWMTRSDGTLLGFTYEPDEDVLGWSRHVTGSTLLTPVGIFESVARISGSVEDEIWVSVQRQFSGVNSGNPVRYIERFATRFTDQLDEAVHVDSFVQDISDAGSQNIILASDTVRCGAGNCNSSLCGGTIA
jgi:hypothetical protein